MRQGSRIGPLLFTLYTSSLIRVIHDKFPNVTCHCYTDDTQLLFLKPTPDNHNASLLLLEKCTDFIHNLMLKNKLKSNDSKSEFLIIGSPQQISKVNIDSVRVGSSNVETVNSARNLRVFLHSNLNIKMHVKAVCKSTNHILYNLRRIRKYFDEDSMKFIVHALVTSKHDCCNGLLFRMPTL